SSSRTEKKKQQPKNKNDEESHFQKAMTTTRQKMKPKTTLKSTSQSKLTQLSPLECRILNHGHKFIPIPTAKQCIDITLPENYLETISHEFESFHCYWVSAVK
ncbi:351_t:CDS:2, partial [Cetraspora pellucida]